MDSNAAGGPPLRALAFVLIAAAIVFPQNLVIDAVRASGGTADLTSGFLLFRIALGACGLLLGLVAHYDVGVASVGVLRAPLGQPDAMPRYAIVALTGLVLLAAALRVPQLGNGLWFDEIVTLVSHVRPPVLTLFTAFGDQNHHPLYSLLAKLSLTLFGDSADALRLPALLFGITSIGALYWFGAQVGSRREALLAAALLTVSYHHVWFSQNARAYTALLFFSLVGTGLCARLCQERAAGAGRTAAAYALVMSLAVYAHLTAALIVIGHLLVWLVAVARHERWRFALTSAPAIGFLFAGVVSLVLYAPGLPQIMQGLGGGEPALDIAWRSPLWMLAETMRGLARAVPGGFPAIAIAAIAPVAGLISFAARDRVITALMIVPPLITAAMLLAAGHNLWPRFFFFAAGFAVLITIRGLFAIAGRIVPRYADSVATAVTLLAVAGAAALLPSAWGPKQDFAGAFQYVEAKRAAGDGVVVVGIAAYPFVQYLGAADWRSAQTAAELHQASADGRTWLVFVMPELIAARSAELWSMIEHDYTEVALFPGTLAGGAIHVMVRQ